MYYWFQRNWPILLTTTLFWFCSQQLKPSFLCTQHRQAKRNAKREVVVKRHANLSCRTCSKKLADRDLLPWPSKVARMIA